MSNPSPAGYRRVLEDPRESGAPSLPGAERIGEVILVEGKSAMGRERSRPPPPEKVYSSVMEMRQKDFRDPVDLLTECREEQAGIPTTSFITDPEHRPRQEKWCAATFGAGYLKYVDPCRVSVNYSQERKDVDFFLEARGREFPFQTTECLSEGRRRDEEYRRLSEVESRIENEPDRVAEFLSAVLTPHRPALGFEKGPEWIEAAIARKTKKYYAEARELNLLVYANFTAPELDVRNVRERAKAHRYKFASIWIITDRHICTLFSNELIGELPEGKWGEL